MRRRSFLAMVALFFALLSPADASARCVVSRTGGAPLEEAPGDPLHRLLMRLAGCPRDVFELREALVRDGLTLRTTLVANRGFHNPGRGSFSLFEMAVGASRAGARSVEAGELFFGHFTAPTDASTLGLDQVPAQGALMVELIAWDPSKRLFNFYELIGDGSGGRWFYRGDSADVAGDIRSLHLQADPSRPRFGRTLRCSGCHLGGGPIMKELSFPHNDWWEPGRGLSFGGRKPSRELDDVLRTLVPAGELAHAVRAGMGKLGAGSGQTLVQQLRPLFCPMEVNFESDERELGAALSALQVPSAMFVDPRLAQSALMSDAAAYRRALAALRSRFPEVMLADADHAWLAPVKAFSDRIAVDRLVEQGIVDQKFVVAALSVDLTQPVFSRIRCGLLKLVPEQASPGWRPAFEGALAVAVQGHDPMLAQGARQMLAYLTDSAWTVERLRSRAREFLLGCQRALASDDLTPYVRLLGQRRVEIGASEVSKNPLGQILEPGFRVIFPVIQPEPQPGKLWLTEQCQVRESR